MCTVSLVAAADGSALRLLMNRDERRLRRVAQPPVVRPTDAGLAVWPADPDGGGTWIAATDAGLALAVLNVDGHRRQPGQFSRGLVIPMLASARSIDEVIAGWRRLEVSAFAPFRLIALTHERVAVCGVFEPAPAVRRASRAQVFASSALGDAQVESARSALFARMLPTEIDPWTAQTRFHQHAWPDRRHVSVMMSRVDACTVSQTEVLLTATSVSLAYRPVIDGWPGTETRRTLAVVAASAHAA